MIGEPGIVDLLKSRKDQAEAETRLRKRDYSESCDLELRLSRALMEADLDGRPDPWLDSERMKAETGRMRARRAWNDAQRREIQAARRYAAFCQGMI